MKRWRVVVGGQEIARFWFRRNAVAQCVALIEHHPVVYMQQRSLGIWHWYQTFFGHNGRRMSDEG